MPRHISPDGLSPKQRRFVEEYLVDLNATQAALRAGYSAKTAHVTGPENLEKPVVQQAIAVAQQARSQRTHITQDAILQEIALLAHSDILHYVIDDHGDVQLRADAPPLAMRAVASLKKKIMYTDTGPLYETEIKLWNKPASLKMGGDHLGLFREGSVTSPDVQAIQADRAATVLALRQRLDEIARRHRQAPVDIRDESITS